LTSTGTFLDRKHAAKAIKFVASAGKMAGKPVPIRVPMTRQKAVGVSHTVKAAIENMRKNGIEVFECQLIERDAFAALFGYASLLFDLDPKQVNEPGRAYMNARVFVNHVLAALASGTDDRRRTPRSNSEAA